MDLNNHRSALLTAEDVEAATLIVGVTRSHVATVESRFPSSKGKIFSLSSDVPDPWHQSMAVYRQCAAVMKPLVYEILSEKLDNHCNDTCPRK